MSERKGPHGSGTGPERELALLVESVADYAIFLLDREGHVRTWNAGAERNKGYRADEIIGQHFSRFYTEEDRAAGRPALALRTAETEGRFEDESWRVRKGGARFWANVVITALRDEDGQLLGFGKVTRDLTDRHQAQEDLERFAASAAHDLHEPLRSISGFAGLLSRRYASLLPPDGQEFLGHINTSAQRMQQLIDSVLEYARSGARDLAAEPTDVSPVVEDVLTGLSAAREARSAVVSVDVPAGARVLADRPAVELVLQNLIANAIKHGAEESPEVRVEARRAGADWEITVSDNGEGIAEDQRERVFDAFTQASKGAGGGVGLGLAIARRLAGRQGGHLGLDEAPGGGCAFRLSLPAAD